METENKREKIAKLVEICPKKELEKLRRHVRRVTHHQKGLVLKNFRKRIKRGEPKEADQDEMEYIMVSQRDILNERIVSVRRRRVTLGTQATISVVTRACGFPDGVLSWNLPRIRPIVHSHVWLPLIDFLGR